MRRYAGVVSVWLAPLLVGLAITCALFRGYFAFPIQQALFYAGTAGALALCAAALRGWLRLRFSAASRALPPTPNLTLRQHVVLWFGSVIAIAGTWLVVSHRPWLGGGIALVGAALTVASLSPRSSRLVHRLLRAAA